MRKNAALESSNVAVLLEHIPVGQTRSIHSLQVTRVEPDHYSIGGGKVMDLVDAISQIGSYTGHGKVSNPRRRNPAAGAKPKQSAGSSSNAQERLEKIMLKLEMYYRTPSMLRSEGAIEEDLVPMLDHVNDIARATARAPRYSASGQMHQQALGLEEDLADLIRRAEEEQGKRAAYEAAVPERLRDLEESVDDDEREVFPSTRRNPRSLFKKPHIDAKERQVMQYLRSPPMSIEQVGEAQELYGDLKHMMETAGPTDPQYRRLKELVFELAEAGYGEEPDEEEQPYRPPMRAMWFSNPRATAKVSNPQKSERGYFYEVLDSKGRAVMLTTNKAEAEEVASDPLSYKLKKGTYTFRHIGAVSALESPPFRRL